MSLDQELCWRSRCVLSRLSRRQRDLGHLGDQFVRPRRLPYLAAERGRRGAERGEERNRAGETSRGAGGLRESPLENTKPRIAPGLRSQTNQSNKPNQRTNQIRFALAGCVF